MRYKDFLGNKKTTLSISISKSIKDYLERYQRSIFKKSNDKRFKNISVFINNILEICVHFFSLGNELDQLSMIQKIPSKEVKDFYEKLLVGVNPYQFEESVKLDKYRPIGKLSFNTYAQYWNFAVGAMKMDITSDIDFIRMFKLMEKFLLKNKLTEGFDSYLQNDYIVVEYRGFFSNIHYVYSKGIAGLIGYFGLKLHDFYYEDKYTRFVFNKNTLLSDIKFSIKERRKLSSYNANKFASLDQMIKDEKVHLWINLSENEKTILTFKDYISGKEIVTNLISKLENSEAQTILDKNLYFKIKILNLFSVFNWITINDIKTFDFNYNIKEEYHPVEFQIIRSIFKKYKLL